METSPEGVKELEKLEISSAQDDSATSDPVNPDPTEAASSIQTQQSRSEKGGPETAAAMPSAKEGAKETVSPTSAKEGAKMAVSPTSAKEGAKMAVSPTSAGTASASSIPSPSAAAVNPSVRPKSSLSAPKPSTSVIKVFNEDGSSHPLEVPSDIAARDLCQLLITKNQCVHDGSWTIIEQLTHMGIERIVEDHESVMQVQSSWAMDTDCRLYFKKSNAKYEYFRNPMFFPENMVSSCNETDSLSYSQLTQEFLSSRMCPEIHGHLQSREQGKKSWKKYYFILRRSGLYFSTKGTSKEPRHLQFYAEFSECNVYTVLSAKKTYGAPTKFGFCIKYNSLGDAKDLKLFCADDEQTRARWVTAIRLFKFGLQLFQNFMSPQLKSGSMSSPMRSSSESSLVAMDFSGSQGRIIDNPAEALSAAAEEALTWRRRSHHRINPFGSPALAQSYSSRQGLPKAQIWFHPGLSRDDAQKTLERQGFVDGMYLVRDSQSNLKSFVLSLCYGRKIRHFQILQLEEDGRVCYSMDEGRTKFSDLIQLVEFHHLNKGVLPCKLKHACARVAL
ncbi:growth factor receptor-bound protein 14 [Hemitrygon akajei]|uniref:growth factor receptor-bound protein 14 n=1 Tax=Hemitrygon akajei TaxID=2704970 RepID=UPI003BF987D1